MRKIVPFGTVVPSVRLPMSSSPSLLDGHVSVDHTFSAIAPLRPSTTCVATSSIFATALPLVSWPVITRRTRSAIGPLLADRGLRIRHVCCPAEPTPQRISVIRRALARRPTLPRVGRHEGNAARRFLASGWRERHRQPLDAADEVRAQLLRLGRGSDVRQPAEQLDEHRGDLAARQVGAKTEVGAAGPEGALL